MSVSERPPMDHIVRLSAVPVRRASNWAGEDMFPSNPMESSYQNGRSLFRTQSDPCDAIVKETFRPPLATLSNSLAEKRSISDTDALAPDYRGMIGAPKLGPSLRLPSFKLLGIAAPHPDHLRSSCPYPQSQPGGLRQAYNLGSENSRAHQQCSEDGVPSLTDPASFLRRPSGPTAIPTPPDEHPCIEWSSEPEPARSAPSVPSRIGIHNPEGHKSQFVSATTSPDAEKHGRSSNEASASQGSGSSQFGQGPGGSDSSRETGDQDRLADLDIACEELVASALPCAAGAQATRILCQTLPYPHLIKSEDGNGQQPAASGPDMNTKKDHPSYTPSTALTMVVDAIQSRSGARSRRSFLHISHAIKSPSVNLWQLPSSSPLGPSGFTFSGATSPDYFDRSNNMSGHGATSPGYFAPMVFVNAVPVSEVAVKRQTAPPDLQSFDAWLEEQKSAPLPSPNPVVPPFSQHVSILERYIPPPSTEEDQNIFGASVLVDRLFELTPEGGSLLFIYPTKAGAESFARDYLGPVLAPLLRGLMSRYGVQRELCELLDKMSAIEFMLQYEELREKVENICARATKDMRQREADEETSQTSTISLVYSKATAIHLNPEAWKRWWVHQESDRVKRTIRNFYGRGFQPPAGLSQGELQRSILYGVNPLPATAMPGTALPPRPTAMFTPPMEVGLFVLRRSD
ncbi:MAG: hypothetical protein M1825_005880 [Sarcosagium campestre]|nr:MAG: hypothetical protein M1825_005880 [Sarcosagium campestre]